MPLGSDARVVVVAGDVTIAWNAARIPSLGDPHASGGRGTTRVSFEPGGAALLGRVISAVADDLQKRATGPIDVRTVAEPGVRPSLGDGRSTHSLAIWSQFERADGIRVWRISEALGLDAAPAGGDASAWMVPDDPAVADLVVLDAGLGFGSEPLSWPRAIASGNGSPWILLNMARPVATGPLWDHLSATHADRLIAVVRVNDLRVTDAQISRELSWEQTAQDLLWELTYNPDLKELLRCAHLIVSFGTSGALLLSSPKDGPRLARLIFDPLVMEEEWAEEQRGGMIGYTTCLTAGAARELMSAPEEPDLARGIQRGLTAMRALHYGGYHAGDPDPASPRLAFPIERVVDALGDDGTRFAEVLVPDPAISPQPDTGPWTILEEVCPEGLEQVARRIALDGPGELIRRVPAAKFGKLLTVHRQEIEGYRSVRSLIAQYARQPNSERPLSIAVFGRPGSGKSFGIKQIALSMFPKLIASLTFNLSQFHDPAQLLDALHQVRDEPLKGKLPLVFWDEFDAKLGDQELGWLRHFLAPMQDGEFQQGQVTYHVGRAIFVFAGGTKETMLEFSSQQSDAFRNGKGRDFVSRLKGYVDVLGPNPIGGDVGSDPHYVIRRAIMLRSMLDARAHLFNQAGTKKQLQIDPGVLRAFLLTREYAHGARSMESVIAMSLLEGKSRFERSCLPSAEQLGIHVGAHDFLDIVRSLVIEGKLLRDLAEAAHVAYCADMLADGASWAEPGDDYLRRHESLAPYAGREREPSRASASLVAYEELSEDVKEQNEDFARDIPNKVEAVGYELGQSRTGAPGAPFPDEAIELLAEQEHDRWMRLKFRQRWWWGSNLDAERRLHPALLPWREMTEKERVERYGADGASRIGTAVLPEKEKNKDRGLIKAVAKILESDGYRVSEIDRSGARLGAGQP